jgi:hypothetical protein
MLRKIAALKSISIIAKKEQKTIKGGTNDVIINIDLDIM